MNARELKAAKVAVVVPCYRVAPHIRGLLGSIPSFVQHIIVVDDCSPDQTSEIVADLKKADSRIVLIRHERNQGVGGAMVSGFKKALELGAGLVAKIDGDGQMDPRELPHLLRPLITGEADYAKANRFRDFTALRTMPVVRRIGNVVLGFLARAATGYWNCFDPTNGYVAVRADILKKIALLDLHRTFFFEISILGHLYLLNAVVVEIPLGARYGTEESNLSVWGTIVEFPPRLVMMFLRRIILRYFIFDFNLASLFMCMGLPLFLTGVAWGGYEWFRFATSNVAAPTGTVVLPALLIILGFQLLLTAASMDVGSVPNKPLSRALGDRLPLT